MNAELKLSPLSRDTDPFQRRILNMILDFNCDFNMTCSKNNKIKPMFRSYDGKNIQNLSRVFNLMLMHVLTYNYNQF